MKIRNLEIADIWHLTPSELDELLRLAAWMVEYPNAGTSRERHEVVQQLRRMGPQVNPSNYLTAGPTEPTRTGVGDWTGD